MVPTEDAEGDRSDNRSEYIAGTLPHDDTSFLHIIRSESIKTNGNVRTTLKWEPSVEGRIYGVSWTTNLADGFENTTNALPYPVDQVMIDKSLPGAFYKINVHLDD